MSNTDSFIDEVTEEVRRERLFHLARRYGWIAVLGVVALVGGAAWVEYGRATAEAEAQARGDAILAALTSEEPAAQSAALAELAAGAGPSAPALALIEAAAAQEAGNPEAARARLDALAADASAPQVYRDLAALKSLLLSAGTETPEARDAALLALAAPGAPFRLIALEQLALSLVAQGKTEDALARLTEIVEDAAVTPSLRRRAEEVIAALQPAPAADVPAAEAPATDAAAEPPAATTPAAEAPAPEAPAAETPAEAPAAPVTQP